MINAGLPNILGQFPYVVRQKLGGCTGAFADGNPSLQNFVQNNASTYPYNTDNTFIASSSNSIYVKSSTVQPKAMAIQYLIKY